MASSHWPYFKFVSALIDKGIWAELSAAARTLYPVLLRFSDGNFKPVYPGTNTLLKLTGFKHKASLRRARQELIQRGLVTVSLGSGRQNSYYQFRFDFIDNASSLWPSAEAAEREVEGDTQRAPRGNRRSPTEGRREPPLPGGRRSQRGSRREPPYNKIHISINNQLADKNRDRQGEDLSNSSDLGCERDERAQRALLAEQFGREALELAFSECRLSGLDPHVQNLEKILYRDSQYPELSWTEVENYLKRQISAASLELIRRAYIEEQGGLFLFYDILPIHLKRLLERLCGRVLFEQSPEQGPDECLPPDPTRKRAKNRLLQRNS